MPNDSRDAPARLGRYTVHGVIAEGGMATVHFGRVRGAVGFRRVVAIKRMLPRFAHDPDFVAMFLDEARLASRIQHPNVVTTLDVVSEDEETFIVMEYVRGQSLAALLSEMLGRGEKCPIEIATSIMVGVLAGLHAAHEARDAEGRSLGIIHRDVSPPNVLVGADGIARIMDFGVAKAAYQSHVTYEGQLKGKLAYMPPEQLMGKAKPLDRRADVFAAGAVLWGTLAARRLFRGQDLASALNEILHGEIPKLDAFRDDVPPALEEATRRALQRDPDRRFATALDFEIALESAVPRLAPARQVGEWVQRLASGVLAQREQVVAAIEKSAVDDEAEGARPSGPPPDDLDAATRKLAPKHSTSAPPSAPRPRGFAAHHAPAASPERTGRIAAPPSSEAEALLAEDSQEITVASEATPLPVAAPAAQMPRQATPAIPAPTAPAPRLTTPLAMSAPAAQAFVAPAPRPAPTIDAPRTIIASQPALLAPVAAGPHPTPAPRRGPDQRVAAALAVAVVLCAGLGAWILLKAPPPPAPEDAAAPPPTAAENAVAPGPGVTASPPGTAEAVVDPPAAPLEAQPGTPPDRAPPARTSSRKAGAPPDRGRPPPPTSPSPADDGYIPERP